MFIKAPLSLVGLLCHILDIQQTFECYISGHHCQGASNHFFLLFFYVLLFVLTKRVNGLEFECFVVDRPSRVKLSKSRGL